MTEPVGTQTLPISKARQNFGQLVNQVYKRETRFIIEKNGLPAVALVAISDLERWLSQERQAGATGHDSEVTERTVATDHTMVRTATAEALAQRQALVEKILASAAQRNISPVATADLVGEARQEREAAYERWTR